MLALCWVLEPNAGLPAAVKAGTGEAGADVKESGLFSDASNPEEGELSLQACHLGRRGLMSQSPSPPLSAGRGFYKERKGNRTKRPREGIEKFSMCRRAQSIPVRTVMSGVHHPGPTTEGQQISQTLKVRVCIF